VLDPDEGALVDDHLQQPGHRAGLVRLAVREQVPLGWDRTSADRKVGPMPARP